MLPCPACCPDPAACIIDTDDFAGDLSKWTIDTGDWVIDVSDQLTIDEPGRITLIAESATENSSTKIHVHVACVSAGVAYVTTAENAAGDRLAAELTREGECLTVRLCKLLADNTVEEWFTPAVAQFTLAGDEFVIVDLCWVQGEPVDPVETGAAAFPTTFTASDWAAEENIGAEDDVPSVWSLGSGPTDALRGHGFDFSSIPDTATITGISAGVRCRHQDLSDLSVVTLELLRLLIDGTQAGDDRGTGQSVTSTYSGIGSGSSSDLWGLSISVADVKDPDFGLAVAFESDGIEIDVDSMAITVFYTTPDREPGTLTVTCEPELGPAEDGTSGKTMAEHKLYWKGTKAGFTVTSGEWTFDDFTYYIHQVDLAHCPACTPQCFIFGDTFDRVDLGCHYILDSGTWATDDTAAGTLTCVTAGKLYLQHITTEEVNAQVVEFGVTFPSSSNREVWIILGYDADVPTEYYARLRWVNADVKWYLGIYKDGVLIGSEAETTEGPESFPVTTHFKACLLGNSIFAESDFLEIQRTLDEDATGLQAGLFSTADQIFENLRFYQTPFNAEDCPPCGEPDECTICLDGIAPAHLLFRMFSAQNGDDCLQCTLFNESFLLVGIAGGGIHDFDYIDCGETPLSDVTVCSWEYLVSTGPDSCFEPDGAGLYIFAFLVKDNLTNHYYLTVRAGGPSVIGVGYGGGDSYYLLRADLGVHDTEPDCYELLADVQLEFVCIKLRDAVFDCRGTPIGFIAAV